MISELTSYVEKCSSDSFERLVVKLIDKIYGESIGDTGKVLGKTGDGGVDGVINEDELGLRQLYLQAKHWIGSVGSPQLRDFIGALDIKKAQWGIYITSGTFSDSAIETANGSSKSIKLIDGERLVKLMIKRDLGVSVSETYKIKRIDSDFFDEL